MISIKKALENCLQKEIIDKNKNRLSFLTGLNRLINLFVEIDHFFSDNLKSLKQLKT